MHAQRASGCGACPREEVAPVHGTTGTSGDEVVWFHVHVLVVGMVLG